MKRKCTKVISLLAAGFLSISLAACGESPSSASSGSDNSETAKATITTESAESDAVSTEDADEGVSVINADTSQDDSEVLSNQAPDYIQDEVVIADTDKYKLTVTGYDPAYSQGDLEGFLIKKSVENKAEKEYTYMITGCAVNHVSTYGLSLDNIYETVVPSGQSAEMKYVIPSSNLSDLNISSVDALLLALQITSSEFMQALNEGDHLKQESLQESDSDSVYYTLSPTGADYNAVSPAIELTDDNYEILVDNDILTFGFQKNEDGTLFHDNGLLAGIKVQSGMSGKTHIVITEPSIDGKAINEVDVQGNIQYISAMRNIIFSSLLFFISTTISYRHYVPRIPYFTRIF